MKNSIYLFLLGVHTHRVSIAAVIFGLAMIPVSAVIVADMAISPYSRYIFADATTLARNGGTQADAEAQDVEVGMVLGSMVSNGKPYPQLRGRLDAAAAAYQRGDVKTLILSGDNRFNGYDEPTAMINYLVDTYDIPRQDLQPDFAGRSTYESCDRAKRVFGQDRIILFSARSHLSRAIYLCRHLGVEAYGVASNIEANNATRREPLANIKAVYNIYIKGEPTVLGDRISL